MSPSNAKGIRAIALVYFISFYLVVVVVFFFFLFFAGFFCNSTLNGVYLEKYIRFSPFILLCVMCKKEKTSTMILATKEAAVAATTTKK